MKKGVCEINEGQQIFVFTHSPSPPSVCVCKEATVGETTMSVPAPLLGLDTSGSNVTFFSIQGPTEG